MAQTTVTFRIGPPLYRLHEASIQTETPQGSYTTEFQVVDLPATAAAAAQAAGSSIVTIPSDPDGGLHNTLVTVTSPYAHQVDRVPGRSVPEAQVVAIRVLNRFVDHYRALVPLPLLRRIEPRRASWMKYRVVDDEGRVREGTNIVPTGLPPEGTPANVEPRDEQLVQLLRDLSGYSQPAYRTLYLDALAEFETAVLEPAAMTSALAHLFISFEMLAWLAHGAHGRATVGDDLYESDFTVSHEGEPLGIRRILKQLHDWSPSGFASKSKLSESVDTLLRHRNDVMHGRVRDYPVEDVEAAINSYERLNEWLDKVLSDAGGPAAAERARP